MQHRLITKTELADALSKHARDNQNDPLFADSTIELKCEPLILHVCCRDIESARDLHELVLSNGYRESGITIGNKRIMLAIRTTSCCMELPIARGGRLLCEDEYIDVIVGECNRRLTQNFVRIDKLLKALKSRWCWPMVSLLPQKSDFAINRWGHVAVRCLEQKLSSGHALNSVDSILVCGGYGDMAQTQPQTLARKGHACQPKNAPEVASLHDDISGRSCGIQASLLSSDKPSRSCPTRLGRGLSPILCTRECRHSYLAPAQQQTRLRTIHKVARTGTDSSFYLEQTELQVAQPGRGETAMHAATVCLQLSTSSDSGTAVDADISAQSSSSVRSAKQHIIDEDRSLSKEPEPIIPDASGRATGGVTAAAACQQPLQQERSYAPSTVAKELLAARRAMKGGNTVLSTADSGPAGPTPAAPEGTESAAAVCELVVFTGGRESPQYPTSPFVRPYRLVRVPTHLPPPPLPQSQQQTQLVMLPVPVLATAEEEESAGDHPAAADSFARVELEPRWGHSLSVVYSEGDVACCLLHGGRNENTVFNDFVMLTFQLQFDVAMPAGARDVALNGSPPGLDDPRQGGWLDIAL